MSTSHEECRKKVCGVCSRRSSRNLSATDLTYIIKYVDKDFNIKDPDYPSAICNGCHLLLIKKEKGDIVSLPINQSYKTSSSTSSVKFLRSCGERCQCSICKIARSHFNEQRQKKPKRGRPKAADNTPRPRQSIKVCSYCIAELYPGCRHRCYQDRHRSKKVENIEKLLATPKSSQLLASKIVKGTKDDAMLPALRKTLDSYSRKHTTKLYSADDMCLVRKELNLSTRQTLSLGQALRNKAKNVGRRGVLESSLKKKLFDKSHKLDDYFELDSISFLRHVEMDENGKPKVKGSSDGKNDKDKKTKGKKVPKVAENYDEHVITTNNLSQLIDEIIRQRKLNSENILVRVGLDGGGGFLKACLSVFELNKTSTSSKQVITKKFKDSGVKKVLIIGIAPGVPENYVNIKKLWLSIGLHQLNRKFTIATDLKLCNILLGLMSHSSMHPCCWCDIDLHNLQKNGNQRNFASLCDKFWAYFAARATKETAKEYGNVIHLPVMDNVAPSTPVLEVVPPPELHLMLGPVNHLYDEMNKVWPKSEEWLKSCFVKRSDYHGGSFEGNDCRKLLKNIDSLKELCPPKFTRFVDTFSAFNDVVTSCYGLELHPSYKSNIQTFRKNYLKLKISVTPKVHAVFFHVQEFCELTKMGLGPWSEQTSESLHHEFTKCWENYIIKDTKHPHYGKRLLEAVQTFNSLNI